MARRVTTTLLTVTVAVVNKDKETAQRAELPERSCRLTGGEPNCALLLGFPQYILQRGPRPSSRLAMRRRDTHGYLSQVLHFSANAR